MKIDPSELPQLPLQAEASSTKSLTSAVYHILRGSILYGHVEPETKLTVSHVASQFRVSLSAVREALARLAAEGLLETADHRGFRVSPVSKEDLLDLTQTRIDLETMALRRSIENGDKAWKDRVTAAFEALQRSERSSHRLTQRRHVLHGEFHYALVDGCGSRWLLRMLTMLFERSERYRLLSVNYTKIRSEVEREHEELYKAAVLDRDPDKACAIFANHTRQTTEALIEAEERRASAAQTAKAKPAREPRASRSGLRKTASSQAWAD